MARWLNCRTCGLIRWPSNRKELNYGQYLLVLLPVSAEYDMSIHVDATELTDKEAMTVMNRFTSLLSWKNHRPIPQSRGGDITPQIHPFPRETGNFRLLPFSDDSFPDRINGPSEAEQLLALALYREALCEENIPYRFLSYFKILNIKYSDRRSGNSSPIVDWMTENVDTLRDSAAVNRIAEIENNYTAAEYLYGTCRCAIAHANSSPVVDPDDIKDLNRLASDTCIIRALAEKVIREEMSISDEI